MEMKGSLVQKVCVISSPLCTSDGGRGAITFTALEKKLSLDFIL